MASRKDLIEQDAPAKLNLNISCNINEWNRIRDVEGRRLYLYGAIESVDYDEIEGINGRSMVAGIVESIMTINRMDRDLPVEDRIPIMLYINSPGGDLTEGFSLISAISLSKTPIWTVNVGQWSSMSFWIGITGHKRFSLPYMMFLMHDGSQIAAGSSNKVQDQIEFSKRFEQEIIKEHVLAHSNMKPIDYDALSRVEVYMLPEDAKERGFIDEIVSDIDDIL